MVHITVMDQLSEEDVRIMASVAPAPASGAGGVGVGAAGKRAGEAERAAQWPCPRCDSADTKFCYYNNYNLSQPRHFCKACRRYWTRGGALRNVPVGGGTRKPAAPSSSGAASRRKRSGPHCHSSQLSHTAVIATTATPATPVVQVQHSVSTPLPLLPLCCSSQPPPPQPYELSSFVSTLAAMDPDRRLLDLGGSFSSLAAMDPDRRLLDLGGSLSSLIAPPAPMLPYGHFAATGFLFGGGGATIGPPLHQHAHAPGFPQQQPVVSQALPEGFWGMGWPDLSI